MSVIRTLTHPSPSLFRAFWGKIEKHFGLKFSNSRYSTVADAVLGRAIAAGYASADDYLQKFTGESFNAGEYEFWANALTVNETYFMRTISDWQAMRNTVLPGVIRSKRHSRVLRIGSAGCASGEELYSVFLVIAQWFPYLLDWRLELIGGDIDTALLDIARDGGPYSDRSVRLIDPIIRDEHLIHQQNGWFMRDAAKTYTDFRYFNIVKSVDPFLTRDLDILFCRNVLIYFETPTAVQCVRKLVNALSPEGTLILGSSEGFLAEEAGHPASIEDGSFLVRKSGRDHVRAAVPPIGPGDHLQAGESTNPAETTGDVMGNSSWVTTERLLQDARVSIEKSDLARADRQLRTLLLRQESSIEGWYLHGIVLEHSNNLEEALSAFEEAIRLAPEHCMALFQAALVLKRMGQYGRAADRLVALTAVLDARSEEDVVDVDQQLTVGFLRMACRNIFFDLECTHGHHG